MTDATYEGARNWEAIADGWAEWVGTNQARVHVLDAAHLAPAGTVDGLHVLDAGCGEGRFARMLAERGAIVTGIDFSKRMIALAKEKEADEPLGIDYQHADMCDLSRFPPGTFDTAIAYLSIVDVADYERAIAEIARALKPGGAFHFSIVHPCFCPPDSRWKPRKPDMIPIRDVGKLYKKVDNYFPASELRFRMWPTAPAETINYHRPLSDYAHACRRAGLLIRDMLEPTPEPSVAEKYDYLKEFFRAPSFIIFDCVKGAA